MPSIETLPAFAGREVTLRGWLYGKRSGGKVIFMQVRDGTGVCQCVVEASQTEVFRTASSLSQETSLEVRGVVREDSRAPGGCELAVNDIRVIQNAEPYPIARKAHGADFLLSHRHLWLRSQRPSAILRIRHEVIKACREFFDSRGFVLIDTPILTPSAGEDAQTLFPVEYFDEKAYLTQTGQLYLESACMAFGKVYCFGPTFRAERSKTRRHLTEFWMIEPEVAFADLDAVIELAEDLVCHIVKAVMGSHRERLEFLGRNVAALEKVVKPFARMTYDEVVSNLRSEKTRVWLEEETARKKEELQRAIDELAALQEKVAVLKPGREQDKAQDGIAELTEEVREMERDVSERPEHIRLAQSFEWGKDLGGSDETIISRRHDKPVFVTHYPRQAKAFYMKVNPKDDRLVCNMDMLAPEGYGEIIGGSQREENLDILLRNMRDKGINPDAYGWFLDLRRYGSVPHAGFGLGVERTVAWLCGLKHVRETIPFPRLMGRIYP